MGSRPLASTPLGSIADLVSARVALAVAAVIVAVVADAMQAAGQLRSASIPDGVWG